MKKNLIKSTLCIAAMMSVLAPCAFADDPDPEIVNNYLNPNQNSVKSIDRYYIDTNVHDYGNLGKLEIELPKENDPLHTVNVEYAVKKNGNQTVVSSPATIENPADIQDNVVYNGPRIKLKANVTKPIIADFIGITMSCFAFKIGIIRC